MRRKSDRKGGVTTCQAGQGDSSAIGRGQGTDHRTRRGDATGDSDERCPDGVLETNGENATMARGRRGSRGVCFQGENFLFCLVLM